MIHFREINEFMVYLPDIEVVVGTNPFQLCFNKIKKESNQAIIAVSQFKYFQ